MDPAAIPLLLVPVALVFVAVAWQAVRHPVQRRFAFRNMARRPAETVLVIGGSLLGAALITGSFIVGDTLDTSIRASAHRQLGPVDEYVELADADDRAEVENAVAAIDSAPIDGVMSVLAAPVPLSSDASGESRAQPRAQLLEVDFSEAKRFGAHPETTGIEGGTPGAGEVAMTEYLAGNLGVDVGDEVTGYAYGKELHLEVSRVLPNLGIAGLWLGFESTSPNAFVAPGTLEEAISGRVPRESVLPTARVLVSNRGGVEEGAELSDEVAALMEEQIGHGLRVEKAKKRLLDAAETQGEEFSELFLAIGTFAIVAGILLLVNIFVMLAGERKGQLGMMRAVGMRRADLVRGYVIEGALYSLPAGVLGAVLGIGVGWGIVKLAAPIFGGFGDFSLDLIFDFTAASVVGGFCLGLLIAFFTVLFTSIRISRINVISAIRDLPEPTGRRARLRTLVVGTIVSALSLAWFVGSLGNDDAFIGAMLGLPLAAFALLPLLNRLIPRRTAVLLVAATSLAWGIFGNGILDGQFFEAGEIFAFVFQGVLLTFSAVVLLSQAQETFEGAIHRVAARNLPLRLGVAYPLARRFRTGLTLGMYALVMFTMVFISVLAQVFGGQVENAVRKEAGGYDMLVQTSGANPPSPARIASVGGVDHVATLVSGRAVFESETAAEPQPWPVNGIDAGFLEVTPPELEERAPGLATDADAWAEVVANPAVVIVPQFFLQGGGGPPAAVVDIDDVIEVIDPRTGAVTERRVIAFGSSFPVFMSRESVDEALSGGVETSRFWVTTHDSPSDVAARMQGDFIENGLRADSFRSIVEEFQRTQLQFMRLMEGYLALGLLVGIAGLGVVMVRAVRERRHEIGVLRSLGFLPGQIRQAFTYESGFTALEGILVGASLALVTAEQLVSTGEFGEGIAFIIPWGEVAFLCSAALVISLAATAWPALQASRIPPAVALRIAE